MIEILSEGLPLEPRGNSNQRLINSNSTPNESEFIQCSSDQITTILNNSLIFIYLFIF